MDNYLADRWPGDGAPFSPRKPGSGRPRRRSRKGGAIFILSLAVIAVLTAGVWLLQNGVLSLGNSREASAAQETAAVTVAMPSFSPDAAAGLPAVSEAGEEMTPGEIYDALLPSVVSVTADFGGGSAGGGSGVILSADGYLLTNYHVVRGAGEARVMLLENGKYYDAELVGYDAPTDLAILKIDAQGLTPARLGDADALKVGDPVYALGNPMGYLYGSFSAGIVSALDREIDVGGYTMTLIQNTAAISSGSSGGALIDAYGRVVGITSSKIDANDGSAKTEGLEFAVPLGSENRDNLNELISTGTVTRPTIGITCYSGEVDGTEGVLVNSVVEGSPAAKAGLQPGDLITEADGEPVTDVPGLKAVLRRLGVGATLDCTVLRDGKTITVSFILEDYYKVYGDN